MRVIIHSPSQYEPPAGIWWVDVTGEVQSYYVDPSGPAATLGRTIMGSNDPSQVSWDRYFTQLMDSPPYFSLWRDGQLDEAVATPQDTLITMRNRWAQT